jgi:2-amino-4-hydroxy-6-hydroxymethyldihydropteridine diphosphokinase
MIPVAVALGSNVGTRESHLDAAVAALRAHIPDARVSSYYETAYVGSLAEPQPAYLNAALVGHTALPARELLRFLQDIERGKGRTRPYQDAPRTLDLDLILYGNEIIDEAALVVPHPRFRQRRFVLEPLVEIAADWRDPVSGRRVDELLRQLDG